MNVEHYTPKCVHKQLLNIISIQAKNRIAAKCIYYTYYTSPESVLTLPNNYTLDSNDKETLGCDFLLREGAKVTVSCLVLLSKISGDLSGSDD